MRKAVLIGIGFAIALFISPATASAGPVTLNCPGGLSDQSANGAITFGGAGIPKDAVCYGVFGDVTLVLTAHQRFTNPPLTNDAASTYFAGAGDDTANGQPSYAIWNFAWYATNTSTFATYSIDLLWDTDPGAGTDTSLMGHFLQTLAPGATLQDSWNLGMPFIDTGGAVPPFYSPTAGLFNPYVGGEYSFAFNILDANLRSVSGIGINVQVATPVPEPASLALLGLGLVGIATFRRRMSRR